MSDLEKLAQEYGLEVKDMGLDEPLKNKGGSFYVHKTGQFKGVVGTFEVIFLDQEGKKCEADTPGSEPGYGLLRFIIFRDPEKNLLNDKFELDSDEPYGRFVFTQYVPFDKSKQWQNARFFRNFKFANRPELAIIQGEKNSEDIFLKYLQVYYGVPVSFTVNAGKSEDSRFIDGNTIVISDDTITKEKVQKRKEMMKIIEEQLQKKLNAQRQSTETDDSDSDEDNIDPDSYLDQFGV